VRSTAVFFVWQSTQPRSAGSGSAESASAEPLPKLKKAQPSGNF
jgi:hypothetical protein